MFKPQVLILRTAGTNCDVETAHAFELAGAEPVSIHLNRLLEDPNRLRDFQILAIPGGFSYGDDIAAGRIFANQIAHHMSDSMRDFIASGKPIIGICNGYQVLVKTDLLPGPIPGWGRSGQSVTLTNNDTGRFVDRWIRLAGKSEKCIWTAGVESLELPIAHGEGRFVPADDRVIEALWANDQVALVYEGENPNGSIDAIAGICDASGLVFGLMPHPERYVTPSQHPAWTSQHNHRTRDSRAAEGPGLAMFKNATEHVRNAVGAGV